MATLILAVILTFLVGGQAVPGDVTVTYGLMYGLRVAMYPLRDSLGVHDETKGTWELVQVAESETYNLAEVDWSPKGRRQIIFAARGCKDVIITLNAKSTNSYVMMYLGYLTNTYALIIPSSACDASGSCSITNFAQGAFLDCSNFKFFWAQWDLSGNFALGTGYNLGQNTIIQLSGTGLTEEAVFMTFLVNDAAGGMLYLFKDDGPEFDDPAPDGTTELTMKETSVTGKVLYTVKATDPEGDNITAFLYEQTDAFNFSGNDLTNLKALDYETKRIYVITLSIHDQANVANTTLTILLENVYDEAPSVDSTTVTIAEEPKIGSYIDGGYTVSDIEEGDQLTYALTGTHASYFSITSDGRLMVAARIDFDPPNSVTKLDQLTLTVTDIGSNTNSTALTITVTDVNDNKPTFSKPLYTADVAEGAGTVSLFRLTVTDDDSGVNGNYDVTMDGDVPSDPLFTLDPSTLELSVDANKLDYENLEAEDFIWRLTFVAKDKSTDFQPLSGTAFALIRVLPVNEHTPVWSSQPADMTVSESTSPGTLLSPSVYAATDGDLGKDGVIKYEVMQATDDTGSASQDKFCYDSGSGSFTLASPLDYDKLTGGVKYFDVKVRAVDGGTSPKSVEATFRITLSPENDNPPVFNDTLYQTVVAEDVSINSVILSVAATDVDGDALTYTIVGEGQGIFDLTTDLINLKALDYEKRQCYTFKLKASDGVHETLVPINIKVSNVIDEPPVLTVTSPFNINEELSVGTILGGVYGVKDDDEDDTLTFSLSGTEASYFSINSTTGLISINQRIDRDTGLTSISQVTLTVTDAGSNSASKPLSFIIVDVNDNSPQFSSDVINMNLTENTVIDTVVTNLIVTDDDDGDNAKVVITILDGDDIAPNEKFKIDGVDLKTRTTAADYETKTQYTLRVQAVDQAKKDPARTSVAVVVVNVLPVNEHTPVWTVTPSDLSVSESTAAGIILAQYKATDGDHGTDGDVTYQLVEVFDDTGKNGSDKFYFDSGNGDFILSSTLDADPATGGVSYYDVKVRATDGGVNPRSVETMFRISVGYSNDNAPVFNDTLYQALVAEDVSISTVMLVATAKDADGDAVSYSITGEGVGTFDHVTDLINTELLDYEKERCYTFRLRATDGLHVTEVAININISNVIDEVPVLTVVKPYSLVEELPIGTPLGGVHNASDRDIDDTLTFTLEGADSSYFSIDAATGLMSIAQRIDRDSGLTSISQLTLKVTDAGGNSASEPLGFTIVDINDNSPQFSNDVLYVNVTENTGPDQVLLTLACTDDDDGNNAAINVTIKSGGTTPPRFKLQGMDLKTTSQAVNYEDPDVPGNLYTLTLLATDSPTTGSPNRAILTVILMVLPENEFTPTFTTPSSTGVTLPETTESGYLVDTFIATDDDNGDDGQIVYEITTVIDPSGASAISKFLIDELSGKLRLAETLDVDVATGGVAYYEITVKATDKGSPARSSTKLFVVTLQNENDNAPVFIDFPRIVDVQEDTNIGDVILILTTKDVDGDVLTESLADGDVTQFSVSGSDVTLQQELDYETSAGHIIVISITDGLHTVNKTLAVRVIDVIDEPPVIETFTPVNVTEELPIGTEIDGLYYVTDLDRGDSFIFSLSGTHSSYFTINSTSGQIKIAKRIDLEALAGQTTLDQLTLTVEDKGGLQTTAALSVQILDINDAYPTFTEPVYKVNISESSSTEELLNLVCTDADSGINGATSLQITDGDDPISNKFQLNGTKLFALGADLDYESLESTQYMYILTVSCTDAPQNEAPKTGVTLVVVSVLPVNEHTPVWAASLSVSGGTLPDLQMLENTTVGSDLLTLVATDADHGSDGVVSYNISSVTTNVGTSAPELFSVDATSGVLRIARSLDRDITTGDMFYTLVLVARDGGKPHKETTTTLKVKLENVNDNAPVFKSSDYLVEITETNAVGIVIHTFAGATDADSDTITYSVTGGASSVFGITGLDVKTQAPLDFEMERCYSLVIEAYDGLHTVNITMTVKVKDIIDEKPVIAAVSPLVIPEEIPIGTRICWAVNVTDEDKGDVLQYSMTGTDAGYFNLNTNTGELTTAKRLDREAIATLADLTLRVEDTGGLSDEVVLSIDVVDINDVTPVFSQDVHVVFVTEGGGEVDLVNLVVTDHDLADNGKFDVTITSGNGGGEFRLDGMILKGDTSLMDYDQSAASNYTYVVIVEAVDKPTEGASRTGETTIVVHVGPLNEFSPVWLSPAVTAGTFPDVTIPESAVTLTKSLVTYNASDDDSGEHGFITYSIVSAATAEGKDATGVFLINPVDGTLWMTKEPDADAASGGTSSYDITIKAEDGGLRSIQAKQTVHVTNINDNPPTVWTMSYSEDVAESVSVGSAIFTLNVTDIDGDAVTSAVRQGSEYFHFDGTSVSIKKALDFETQECHTIVLSASDGVHDVNVTLTVNVTDANDNSPEVTVRSSVSIPEELPLDTIIGGVYDATDRDEGDVLSYSLSGADGQFVEINPTTGELKVKSRIDRDGVSGVTVLDDLTLTVTDLGGHNTVARLNISVLDINDNSPLCTQTVFAVNITENSTDGLVAKLNCTDADAGDNGVFGVSITSGNDLGHISLSGLNLHAAASNIDYDTLDTSAPYIVSLSAVDQPTTETPKTAHISLIIQVIPQNEFSPVWKSPGVDASGNFPSQTLSEITPPGSVIITVTATDMDAGADGDITYDIFAASDENNRDRSSLFLIDASSGILRTSGILDRDPPDGMAKIEIIIKASDGGTVSKTTTGTLVIDVTAENDNPPVFTDMPTEVDVLENSATGTVILNLQASDIDGDSVDFEVSGSEAPLFQIVGSNLKLFQQLDYETKQCHVLELTAKDGLHTSNISVTVNVLNIVDESPVITLNPPLEIPEELPVGMAIGGLFSVSDKDEGDNLTHTLTGTGSSYFQMNANGELLIAKRIDRDSPGDVTVIDGLTLTVTDTAGLKADINLTFTIVDINDNLPVCGITVNQVNVTENSIPDVLLSDITCTDIDSGSYGTVAVTMDASSDPNGHFKLSGTELKTDANPVDYESAAGTEHIIKILAEDNPGGTIQLTATTTITVKVLPVNEHNPVFTTPPVDANGNFNDITVHENVTTGTILSTFTATDDDSGKDGEILFRISSIITDSGISAQDIFTIDSSTGVLRVSGELDADYASGGVSFYTINITAEDSGSTPLSTQGSVRVLVTGTNDNPPEWNTTLLEVEVYENVSVGDEILTLSAFDLDGDQVTFTTSDTMFEITGSKVKVKQQLDFEKERCHTLTISASDGKYTTNMTLTAHVLDLNDESPVITFTTAMSIPEELPVETNLARSYITSDGDQNDNLTYSLSGTGSTYFSINSMTGVLSIAKRIDRDYPSNITFVDDLSLTVTDLAGHQKTVFLNITVDDVNDNPPICEATAGLLDVKENTLPGSVLAKVNCSDLDSGNYGNINLSIDTTSDPGGYFQMSGTELLTGASVLNYETAKDTNYVQTVDILAVDNQGGDIQLRSVLTVSVKILPVNEHSPHFLSPTLDGSGKFPDITVAEDITVGAALKSFNATDDDQGDDGQVSYAITAITSDSGMSTQDIFTIDSSTGVLRVSGELDADYASGGVSFYTINITAEDSGSTPLSTQGSVRVLVTGTNDNPPEWNTTLLEVEVYENVSVGDEILTLSAFDLDGDQVTFTTSDTMFEIAGSKVKVKQQLDFEKERCHTLTISASDGKYTVNQTLTIHVLDSNDESPVITATVPMLVPEELPIGSGVARGYIVTNSENDALTYNLEGSDSSLLAINSTTGEITVQQRMDFESLSNPGNLDISLKVTDSVGHAVTFPLNLTVTDINDNSPVFTQAVHIVYQKENAVGETILLTLTCMDADSGNNGNFSFNISDGNNAGLFRLDGDDLYGQVLDYETTESQDFMYSLTITAADHGYKPKTAVTVVVVKILPVNEYDPVCQSPSIDGSGRFPDVTLSESELPGYLVVTVTATDQDLGDDGQVIYSIDTVVADTGTNGDAMFTISPISGVLSTGSPLDFDQSTGGVNHYDITVRVTDKGNQSRSTVAIQRVILKNYNDITPAFTKTSFRANVGCHDPIGTILTKLSAEDEDGPTMEYGTALGSNPYVTVDNSGNVVLQAKPSGSSVTDLAQSVSVVASDKGTPELKGFSRLLVLFENCENATVCENVTTTSTTASTTTLPPVTAPPGPTSSATPASGNCTTPQPCICNATSTAVPAPPFEDVIEAWAVRILCMALAATLLGATIWYCRPRGPPRPRKPPKRVFPRTNAFERGIGDDSGKRFDDLENHVLHR